MALSTPLKIATTTAREAVSKELTGPSATWRARRSSSCCCWRCCSRSLILVVLDRLDSWPAAGTVLSTATGRLPHRDAAVAPPTTAGIHQGLRGTFWIGVFTVVVAFPLGIAAAIYLEEYAPKNRFTRFIDINIRNLAGVPSIVYGILGFAIFVERAAGRHRRPQRDRRRAHPRDPGPADRDHHLRRGDPCRADRACARPATAWAPPAGRSIRSHVLPYAAPGILTGTVLSLARALGEAAPLILVGAVTNRLGSDPPILDLAALQDRFTAMPDRDHHLGRQAPGRGSGADTAAAIVVLLVIVLIANAGAVLLRNQYEKKR